MPDMGLPLAYGAGTAPDTLEQIIKERLLIQAQEQQRQRDEWQRQYQGRMAGVAEGRFGLEQEEHTARMPGVRAETNVAVETAPTRIFRAKKESERAGTEADRSALGLSEDQADAAAQTPEGRRVRNAPQAWQPFMQMPGGKSPDQINYEQAMELARQAGRNAAAASGASAPEPRILSPRKILTPDGRNITLVEAVDPRTGQTVWKKEEVSTKTADITNRAEFIRQFSQQLPRLRQISLGSQGVQKEKLVGPASSGLNVGSGPARCYGA